jgi:hypothetical protein
MRARFVRRGEYDTLSWEYKHNCYCGLSLCLTISGNDGGRTRCPDPDPENESAEK